MHFAINCQRTHLHVRKYNRKHCNLLFIIELEHCLFQLIDSSVQWNSTIINDHFLKTIKKTLATKSTFFTNHKSIRMLNYQYKVLHKRWLVEISNYLVLKTFSIFCYKLPSSENLTISNGGKSIKCPWTPATCTL